ncbi:angiotensin-converting enzyme isoform X2 [Hydra vulgaris]|uniref:Angiotensin-converting enzyme n=1 Tax=Hydra vulgaris TaxID=6087 RepID=A0ABM4B4R6_HYDVU
MSYAVFVLLIAACNQNIISCNAKQSALDFLKDYNNKSKFMEYEYAEASFIKATNITDYNTNMAEAASINYSKRMKELRSEALKVDMTNADDDSKRQLQMLNVTMESTNADIVKNISIIAGKMENLYSTTTIPYNKKFIKLITPMVNQLSLDQHLKKILADSRDPDELLYVWEEWHNLAGPPIRNLYTEFVKLNNIGARENDYHDAGDYKRKVYEIDDLQNVVEKFWEELKPFYQEVHSYVRYKLIAQYPNLVKDGEPIPAHLLGDMWAQSWANVFSLTAPYPDEPSLDVTAELKKQNYDYLKMFKKAEEFFTSIGWPSLPPSFWKKSMFVRPNDRNVTCHASAWDFSVVIDGSQDVRVKMCTEVTQDDFNTIHHELGHIYYYLLYWDQPSLYRTGANPGFHEAVGDTLVLSVQTPEHLKKIGILESVSNSSGADINFLLKTAMEKIAFLPFGYLMDKWMWGVYSGDIKPSEYNKKWWEYKLKYQGVKPSTVRNEEFFDPGAKYHIPADTSYIRYFFAHILQFTFHKHACKAAKYEGPLHKCSIYESKEAGKAFGDMLKLGKSKTWQVALKQLTGSEELSADAIKEYFSPLQTWLENQRKTKKYTLGWEGKPKSNNSALFNNNIRMLFVLLTFSLFELLF